MDNVWERSIPFYNIGIDEITNIFKQYDNHLEILNFNPINIGCRNSNYKIETSKGFFLLRICPIKDTSYKKEKAVNELFQGSLKIPRLLFVSENNTTGRTCLIYEYINGNSMQEIVTQNGRLEDEVIVQVAEIAACIHNFHVINNGEFDTLDAYPPFLTWYDLFLENDLVTERIGKGVKERINKLIRDKKSELTEIDDYISFIHSDFRPANMIIEKNNIWVVDWEFSGFGHSLADIGQFFRYAHCFDLKQTKEFENVYTSLSKRALPNNWYELSKLRDLVNPLQMLGAKEDLSQKYEDLKNLVLDSLTFFGY